MDVRSPIEYLNVVDVEKYAVNIWVLKGTNIKLSVHAHRKGYTTCSLRCVQEISLLWEPIVKQDARNNDSPQLDTTIRCSKLIRLKRNLSQADGGWKPNHSGTEVNLNWMRDLAQNVCRVDEYINRCLVFLQCLITLAGGHLTGYIILRKRNRSTPLSVFQYLYFL